VDYTPEQCSLGRNWHMLNNVVTDYRREILEVARHLLVEDGYKNLSMRKIARQLACSQGTIYLYFKNKDEIFYALIDEGTEQLYHHYQTILTIPIERFL